jgi:hypothetical protein
MVLRALSTIRRLPTLALELRRSWIGERMRSKFRHHRRARLISTKVELSTPPIFRRSSETGAAAAQVTSTAAER